MGKQITSYPFSAIVGQDKLKKALILNAVNPRLGGVLIRGEKGTAKSTAVRALTALLPEIEIAGECMFSCNPRRETQLCQGCRELIEQGNVLDQRLRKTRLIELPVGATEDRVLGTLDLEHAIKKGEKRFEPGILAQANQGILYVDEINLLDDHIVDILLDSAAMGVNTIEREGVSFWHPAEFMLIGTMNPEEGELRPQLLDRFGLCVSIEGIADINQRVEVVKRRTHYEQDPAGFCEIWRNREEDLMQKIMQARELLDVVDVPDEIVYMIAQIAIDTNIDGHRADIVMAKGAKTLAAFCGRKEVAAEDVEGIAEMALQHRIRRRPFQDQGIASEQLAGIISHAHYHKHDYGHSHFHSHSS